jgi:hypothetical protein
MNKFYIKEIRREQWQIFQRGSNVPVYDKNGEYPLTFRTTLQNDGNELAAKYAEKLNAESSDT